ncbi:glycerophosphodiester phosphodiesterase [Rhodovibrio sodomensis]|uniref:Glycerophosphodiester phosphodiesterase n=2 Tax=Rhodovibrio sodomensis TaxID=1088 RepID=A0ABS1DF58_9PROT|nr:glycerophosphodiester phosphodiesterase [Rhodovibrio sodomensis]
MVATMILAAGAVSAAPASAQEAHEATLAGHAYLAADTFVPIPDDAPDALAISAKFAGPNNLRTEQLETIETSSFMSADGAPRLTGADRPHAGQPVQGFSGIKPAGDGGYYVMADNGFGNKANSPDAMLMVHKVDPAWERGEVELEETIYLKDPNKVLPFQLTNENTENRYLTGSDFDPESFQIVENANGETRFWFGDEFGPYLFATTPEGVVTEFHQVKVDGEIVRSPDHFALKLPTEPGGSVDFSVRRSRGLEGMAASPDGKMLYPMFEGPLYRNGSYEAAQGGQFLRIVEFDVSEGEFTGRSFKYPLAQNGLSIGDFNMIDDNSALVIERDWGEGRPAKACEGEPTPNCFNKPAKFKRVYTISFDGVKDGGFVKKTGYVDLMNIKDPNDNAVLGGQGKGFTFPLVTIEDVHMVDDRHIIVGNDNNYGVSMGRKLGQQDHNELILLETPELLQQAMQN